MLKTEVRNIKDNSADDLSHWIAKIQEQFKKNNFKCALDLIMKGLVRFPNHPSLLNRLIIVDQRWNFPISGNGIYLANPSEEDLSYFLQCYDNAEFMSQFLPMGRKRKNTESILFALKDNEFSVAKYRTIHWIIKKENREGQARMVSSNHLKSIGLASLVDIQFAHRRAEIVVGIPHKDDRKESSAEIAILLVLDFAFNHIGLHKLTSKVLANNPHSQRCTEFIGFTKEGLRQQHLRDPKTLAWLDCYENGMIEDNFRKNILIKNLSERLLRRNITSKIF